MRPFLLSALLILANTAQAGPQTMPAMPPTNFPEAGTFCGVLTLCPQAAKPKASN